LLDTPAFAKHAVDATERRGRRGEGRFDLRLVADVADEREHALGITTGSGQFGLY
jgi:hypothetical protein